MSEELGRVCVGSSNGGQVCQNVEEMCREIVQCSLATSSPLQSLSSTWIIWATCNALLTSTINQLIAWKLIPREKTFATILLRSVEAPFYCTRTAGLDEIFNVKLNSKADLISSTFWFGRIFSCKKALQTRGKKHFPKFWGSTHLVLVLDREELVVDTTSAFLHRAWAFRVVLEHDVPSLPYLLQLGGVIQGTKSLR